MCRSKCTAFVSCVAAIAIVNARLGAQSPPVIEEPERVGPLTDDGGTILRGSITGDGKALYYTVWTRVNNQSVLKTYRATRPSADASFEGGIMLGAPVNIPEARTAYAWVSPDEQYLYFASGDDRAPGLGRDDIWVATKTDPEGGFFDQVRHLGGPVSSAGADRPGCVTADGTQIFLVQNRQLVVVEFIDPYNPFGGFGESRVLAEINGVGAMPPALSPDDLTLFWSDTPPAWWNLAPRPGGHGGADLWMATRASTALGERFGPPVVNMGRPPNSTVDDICPVVSPDGKQLFFSRMAGGLWQAEIATPTAFRRGDANTDGTVNITDPIFSLDHLFGGGVAPSCADSSDANDDGAVNIADAVATLNYLFVDGSFPIPDPGPIDCGPDPTPDGDQELGCGAYPAPCE